MQPQSPPSMTKVVMDVDTASELVDLIDDVPGDADENALDDALAALRNATDRIPADDQRDVADGDAVALEIRAATADAVATLIVENEAEAKRPLRRTARRLRAKLARARRRSRRP